LPTDLISRFRLKKKIVNEQRSLSDIQNEGRGEKKRREAKIKQKKERKRSKVEEG